jgi:UPF0042 nucleotide-binding protein
MPDESKIELLLVSGVSGAGKTTVASVCEEHGYYVTEDIPASMIPSLLAVFKREKGQYGKVALFVDLPSFREVVSEVKSDQEIEVSVWGLDCSLDVLLTRYRLTRHIHPLQPKGYSLNEALLADAKIMEQDLPLFDVYLDTTGLTEKALRIKASALMEKRAHNLNLIISSFGYKYGLPRDAEIVIDSRGLINPYWVPTLSHLTGLDKPVIDYLAKDAHTQEFMGKLITLLDDYLFHAEKEGRTFVIVDVGCSGGQHRSVYVAQALYDHYQNEYDCTVYHREIARYKEDDRE